MIDWARIDELRAEIGAEGFCEVVDLFLDEVRDALVRLPAAVSDPHQFAELMHFVKGSAVNLGFSALADLCQRGEAAAAEGQVMLGPEDVESSFAACCAAFQAGLSQRSTEEEVR